MTLSELVQVGFGRVKCLDGYRFNVAADAFAMCTPVGNQGPWTAFEVVSHGMHPIDPRFQAFRRWCRYDGVRYGFIPEGVIWDVIDAHGGLAE
jgi:hypothetical protein